MMRTEQLTSTPQAPIGLVARAASDDAFRAELERDPAAAFARQGIHIDSMPTSVTLPEKKECEMVAGGVPLEWVGFFI